MPGTPDDLARSVARLAPGTLLAGRYRIRRLLGGGGMGDVYEADDAELGAPVALKTLRAARDERSLERFRREILLARKVTHPNVCRIFDLGWHETDTGRIAFLTMELLAGETLEERIRRDGRRTPAETLRVLGDVAAGLDAAHRAGVVHRDLKCANVMLVPVESGGERAVVTDFGLATGRWGGSGPRLTDILEIVGTPDYMAPEQVEGGAVGPATDVYALGIVAYEALSGRLPFDGATPMSRAVRRLSEDPAPLLAGDRNALPTGWREAVSRALAREPGERFPSASEFVRALSHEGGVDSETRLLERPQPPGRRRPALLVAAVLAAVALLVPAVLYLRRSGDADARTRRKAVAILGFANLSGLPDTAWLGTALSEMLATELAGAEGLRPLPGETVARARADLSLEPAQTLSPETLGRLRKATGAALVVHGTYFDLGPRGGGRVRLDVRLVDAARGELLASFSEAGDETALDAVTTRAGERLRTALGAGREGKPRREPQRDREASRLHAEGLARLRLYDARAAEPFLRQAAERAPSDPLLHADLAEALWTLGRDPEARVAARAAFDRLGDLPREERLAAEGKLQEIVGDTKKSVAALQALRRLFPDDLDYGLRLASVQAEAGDARGSLATVAELRKLPAPAGDDVRLDLAEARALFEAEDYPREVEMAARAAERAGVDGLRGVRARALRLLGTGLRALGRGEEAIRTFEEARSLFAREGDRAAEARVIRDTAGVAWDRNDLTGSRRQVETALGIFREIGDERGLAVALETLAVLEKGQGRPGPARSYLAEARDLYVRQGDQGRRLQATNTLANILVSEGDLVGAARAFREVLDGARARGSEEQAGLAEANLGSVLLWQGDLRGARERTESAVEAFRRIQNHRFEASALRTLARIERETSHPAEEESALARAEGAAKAAAEARDPGLLAARVEQGLRRGDLGAAERAFSRLAEAAGSDADGNVVLERNVLEARVALARRRPDLAQAAVRRALAVAARPADLEPEAKPGLRIVAARVAFAFGRHQDAIRELADVAAQARAGTLALVALEAELRRAEVELALGRRADARSRLEAVASGARLAGALRIAAEADRLHGSGGRS